MLKAKKALKKKRPTRRETETYWNEAQFEKLKSAPPGKLYSKGPLPWRLLAYLLRISPEVAKIRNLIRKRLMDEPRVKAGEVVLDRMLLSLWDGGYVKLEPQPPAKGEKQETPGEPAPTETDSKSFGSSLMLGQARPQPSPGDSAAASDSKTPPPRYSPVLATPTEALEQLLPFRSVNPLYGAFLIEQFGIADRNERLQALESVLGLPRPLLKYVRVPYDLPPGPLATDRLDSELIQRGLLAAPLPPDAGEDEEDDRYEDEPQRPVVLAEKLRLLFDALYPEVNDVETQPVWCAGELLTFGGNFNNYVKSRDLVKQEGIVFRHLLRLILLCEEFSAADAARHGKRPVASRTARSGGTLDGQLPGRRSDEHGRSYPARACGRRRGRGRGSGGQQGDPRLRRALRAARVVLSGDGRRQPLLQRLGEPADFGLQFLTGRFSGRQFARPAELFQRHGGADRAVSAEVRSQAANAVRRPFQRLSVLAGEGRAGFRQQFRRVLEKELSKVVEQLFVTPQPLQRPS